MRRIIGCAFLLVASPLFAQAPPTGVTGLDFTPNNALGTAAAGHGRIRYNSGTNTFQQSLSTGAWVTLGGGVSSVTASAPLASSGGATPNLTCATCLFGSPAAVGDIMYSTAGAQAMTALADVSAGSYLRSGGVASAPVWSTVKLPNTATTGDLVYASAANTYSNLADVVTGRVLKSGGIGVAPAWGIETLQNAYDDGATGLIVLSASGPINARRTNVLQVSTASVAGVELSNPTLPPDANPGNKQYSPILMLDSYGFSSLVGGGTATQTGWMIQNWAVPGGHASPQLEFFAIQDNALTPGGTEMMKIVVDPTNSGLGNPSVTLLATSSLFFILQAEGTDGCISMRTNVTDIVEARGVRFGPIAGVTYANAQLTAWENPSGTPIATVGPTGVFQAPQYTIRLPGLLLVGSTSSYNLATGVQIGGQGIANVALIVDSPAAAFSNGTHMQEWKSAGTLQASMVFGTGGANPQLQSNSHAMSVFNDNTDGLQMGNNTAALLIAGTNVFRANVNSFAEFQRGALYKRRGVADTSPTLDGTDLYVGFSSIGAARVVNLPAASTGAGRVIIVADESGSASVTNTITITRAGADTIDGATTNVINAAYGSRTLVSDGTSKWTVISSLL